MARTPIPTLATSRLHLRAFTEADAPDFHAAYGNPSAMRYWHHEASPNVARTAKYIGHWIAPPPDGWMMWAVALAESGRCIGMVNYHNRSTRHRRAEIGYILSPAASGQGYGREAVAAMIAYMHEALAINRIEAEIDPRNASSRALVAHLGFTLEAPLLRARMRLGEGYVDSCLYALVGAA